ncbi:peptidylprolyl isomerase [Rhizobacter sp. Root404]|uniref:peptidylprolyl isomerase n=1 Tax=Rhizobacter sp. Root404 TaxID=1736528 RepID=UPI0006FF4135|nr:peptidylprolyl isomerase [Rhizobacter sp. Root404]KQW38935.1 molecular chaperone SurA [Rhizobacter sp. Root404]
MTEFPFFRRAALRTASVLALCLAVPLAPAQTRSSSAPSMADYIVAVVNQELVTNGELQARLARIREEAARANQTLPPPAELRKQVLDALIDERVQVTNARETGPKIDEAEVDRAVANVAVQNQMTMPQLRARLQQQGMAYSTFRNNVRDQLAVERVREREVNQRIRITDSDVDALIEQRRAASGNGVQLNLAQILVTVPENASAEVVAQRRARAEAALARVRGGEDFIAVAREISEDGNKAQGGVIGLRQADRLPDVFVEAVRGLKSGEIAPTLLKSGAGFHVLKVITRQEGAAFSVQQTHARHILLRVSPQLSAEAAGRRLAEFKRQIVAGTKSFEQLARENSEDGSAQIGGDLGWTSPGTFVPEFEETMNALPINGISEPVLSRFGVHLIQVLERREVLLDAKQQREQARNVLREQKFEAAYLDWVRDLRGRAYIEMREAPQ